MATIMYGAVFGGLVAIIISTAAGWEFRDHSSNGYNMMPMPTLGGLVSISGIIIGTAVGCGYILH